MLIRMSQKWYLKQLISNSKAKTIINENEINESIQTSNEEILNDIAVWLSEGSGRTVESIDDQYINIVKYKLLKGFSYIELPPELRNSAKGLINLQNKDNECHGGAIFDTRTHKKYHPERIKKCDKEHIKNLYYINATFPVTQKDHRK